MADVKPVTDAAVKYGDDRVQEATAPLLAKITNLESNVVDLEKQLADCEGSVTPPTPPTTGRVRRVPVLGGATTNNQTEFNKLNVAWGPIRATREYDGGKGILPVDQYSWFTFAKQFDYVFFSCDEQKSTASYREIADGKHDTKITAMINSVKAKMPNQKGVILLGNEPNTEAVDPATYRDAVEHCIDKFGDVPAPGFIWGVAFSNFNVWGKGSTEGEKWLPRRDTKRFCVETHCYGKDSYAPPSDMLGRSFIPAMHKGNRWENWDWEVGEMSAQEDATKTKKAKWFTDFSNFIQQEKGCAMLPFDTGVGGSAAINTSENSRQAMKTIAERWKTNNWQ